MLTLNECGYGTATLHHRQATVLSQGVIHESARWGWEGIFTQLGGIFTRETSIFTQQLTRVRESANRHVLVDLRNTTTFLIFNFI